MRDSRRRVQLGDERSKRLQPGWFERGVVFAIVHASRRVVVFVDAARDAARAVSTRDALGGAQEGSADASPSREFVDGEVGDVRDVLAAEFHLGGLDAIREEDADDADDRGGG